MDEGLPKITRRMFGKLAAGVIAQPQIGKEALAEAVGSLGTEPQGLEQKVARLTHFFLDKNSLVDPGEIEGALNVSKRLTSTALSGHDRWRVNLERFERLFHVTPRDMSLGDFTEEILSRAKGFVPDELLDEYRPENVRKLADELRNVTGIQSDSFDEYLDRIKSLVRSEVESYAGPFTPGDK